MADRVVVFLDYQNVYRGARETFHHYGADHTRGQIDPLELGRWLADASNRELKEVRVYRGKPDATRDPKGFGACSRQVDIWEQVARVCRDHPHAALPERLATEFATGGEARGEGH